jgi:hypothetical protein
MNQKPIFPRTQIWKRRALSKVDVVRNSSFPSALDQAKQCRALGNTRSAADKNDKTSVRFGIRQT